MTRPAILLVAFAIIFETAASGADEPAKPKPPAIGAAVPSFTLKDTRRRPRSLDGFKDKKAFVVIFIGAECPLANLYVPTLIEMHKEYSGKGVQFLAVNSNEQDGFALVAAHAQERGVPFPVLKDFEHKAADAFGAERTPEAFVLDSNLVIRYRGRIDDQYGIGFQREKPTKRELRAALDEVLACKPVTVAKTEAPGCVIARAKKPRMAGEVTYAKQVSRILQNRCQECHRPNEIGPMSLLTYEKARAWADTIHEVVIEERMPPWYADHRYGKFDNDRRLSDDEKNTLLAWVEQGCPKGDDKDLPPAKVFPEGWRIGKPDRIIQMQEEYRVPAKGILPYKKFTVDPGFKEDVWVKAAEIKPGNRAVVHHVLVYIQTPGRPIYAADGTAMTLSGWAPGDMPAMYEPGLAKRVPAGAKLVFEVHYTPNGTEQTDRSSLGLIFAKEPPRQEVEVNILANLGLKIPPGVANQKGEMTFTFKDDALIVSLMPHMHLRGTSAKYVAEYPDGKKETLLSVPDYDFNWQSLYRFKEPIRVPRGTKLIWSATWDNSPDNPRNPDPTKTVYWGLQTFDEMQNGWMELIWLKGKGK